jgi:NAD(P)-dependent dehydrogenase (short-subunit alcohol dehydrogenase family)
MLPLRVTTRQPPGRFAREDKKMYDLSRHTAIITGASSGIGASIARTFAMGGARLILAARRADRLEALQHELGLGHDRVLVRPTDVTQEADVVGLFADAEAFSPVTLLIANAGIASHCPTLDETLEGWRRMIDVNLTAAFLCGREALRVMQPRKRGRIVNIGSLSARVPRPDTLSYTASKFGLEGLTHSLALDGRAHGITASIVHPGSTISELFGDRTANNTPSDKVMAAQHVAALVATVAGMPDEISVLDATILPIAQPYVGRG